MNGAPSPSRPFPHVVIRASAGTGKTYQLTSRYLGLLASGTPPEEILATTFTRKAAGEILDRVLQRLAAAAGSSAACAELSRAIDNPQLTQPRARRLLIDMVRGLHRLRIGTLDSYFLKMAGGFSLELGLPPGWTICDEVADESLREQAIEAVLDRGRPSELLTLLNLLAKGEAVRGISQLIHGTVTKLFGLYRQTEPGAWEQIPRGKGLSPEELQATLDAVADWPMTDSRWIKARDGDVQSARCENWEALLKQGIGKRLLAGETAYYNKPIPPPLLQLYGGLLKHAQSVLVGQIAAQTMATHKLLERFAEQYRALQERQQAFRFNDVTHRLAAATGVNAPQRLAHRMDGAIHHLLLDEFQDTSPPQWQVLRPLAQSLSRQAGASFFCVGDTKQAIYGWRGGLAELFDAIDGEVADATSQTLATSYRSSPPIIDAVNRVFHNLQRHENLDKLADGVAQWQQQFPAHLTTKTDLPGCVRLEFARVPPQAEDPVEELFKFAAQQIEQHVRQAPQCSVGVLVRTNSAVARMIYLLRRLRVPASEEGGNPLTDSPAVELLLSLLRLADHPGDKVAAFHLATSPLADLLGLTGQPDILATTAIARQIRRRLLDEGYGPVVFDWSRKLADFSDPRDQSRLQQLVEMAYEYQPTSTLRAGDFVKLVQSRRVFDPTTAEVRVMTVHQAKGLEFDIVVLPDLACKLRSQTEPVVAGRPSPTQPIDIVCRYASEEVRALLPERIQQLFDDDCRREIAESLCVLYVAMTRAVHCLHMILSPPEPNEKSLPKTFAGLLRATLAESQAEGIVYEQGDPRWFQALVAAHPPASGPSGGPPAAPLPEKVRLAPPLDRRDRGLERTSPSSLEGGTQVRVSRLLEPISPHALAYGTLVHAWMQEVQWLEDSSSRGGLPEDEQLLAIAARVDPNWSSDARQLRAHAAHLRQQLAEPAVRAALQRSFYSNSESFSWRADEIELEAQTERAFAIREGDELLSGSIDRLVLVRRGGALIAADVLDFKSDDIPPRDARALADKIEFYRPQIETYRKAAARLLRLAPQSVSARLVFLAVGKVCGL